MPKNDLLTTEAVARLLGVSGARVRQLALAGELPKEFTRVGGRRAYRREDITRWIEGRTGTDTRNARSAAKGVRQADEGLLTQVSLTPAGLWVPDTLAAGPQEPNSSIQFFAVRLGAEETLGIRAAWAGVAERLSLYPLAQILDVSARMSAALGRARTDRTLQIQLVQELFLGRAGTIIDAAMRYRRRSMGQSGAEPTIVFFDELQLINMVKVALLSRAPESALRTPNEDPTDLGEALLMINDLIEQCAVAITGDVNVLEAEGKRRIEQFLFINGLFYRSEGRGHALARCYDLYLTDRSHLKGHPDYLDLPSVVRQGFDLEPTALLAVFFAFAGQTLSLSEGSGAAASMNRDNYFSSNFDFTQDEISRFFSLLSSTSTELGEQVRHDYSLENVQPYHMLAFAQRPLVEHNGQVFCPSQRLLFDAMSSGLYHRLLNSLSRREASRFQGYVGAVFEDYVNRQLSRTYASTARPSARHIDGTTVASLVRGAKKQMPKACDGILIAGSRVVLFETKAKKFSLTARTEPNFNYEEKLSEIFVGSCEQLSATIDAIERGELQPLINPTAVTEYLPVIVSLEDVPMWPPLHDALLARVAAKGLFTTSPAKVRTPQLLDAGEFELLEPMANAGIDVSAILSEKAGSQAFQGDAFVNFLALTGRRDLLSGDNPHLATIYGRMGGEAREFFRSRAKQTNEVSRT